MTDRATLYSWLIITAMIAVAILIAITLGDGPHIQRY